MRVYREVSEATQRALELHTNIGRQTAQAAASLWSSWLDARCSTVRIIIVGVTCCQVIVVVGACATIVSGSLSLCRHPPSSRGRRCCCPCRRSLHRHLIVVVAALSWWSPSLSLAACGCYRHTGLTLAPAAATVAEVSMWGGSLGCGKAMVGVGARAAVQTCNYCEHDVGLNRTLTLFVDIWGRRALVCRVNGG